MDIRAHPFNTISVKKKLKLIYNSDEFIRKQTLDNVIFLINLQLTYNVLVLIKCLYLLINKHLK